MTPTRYLHDQLTPAMQDVIRRIARAGRPPLHTLTPTQAKAAYEASADVLELPKPTLARVEDHQLVARDGYKIPVRLYAPSSNALPVLMYFHGGGFTIGSLGTHDILCRQLSLRGDCAVVSVDYQW